MYNGFYKESILSRSGWTHNVGAFLVVSVILLFGHCFLDARVADKVAGIVGYDVVFSEELSQIPDLLLVMVCAVTVLSWGCHLFLMLTRRDPGVADFFEFLGCSVPLAFALKMIFKYVFGKTNTRIFLMSPQLYGLHWFHGGGDYSAFPSGHMAVFTALMLAICRFYPRYRFWCWGLLVMLGIALIGTEYHFFSDVVGGTYLGLIVDHVTDKALFVRHRPG